MLTYTTNAQRYPSKRFVLKIGNSGDDPVRWRPPHQTTRYNPTISASLGTLGLFCGDPGAKAFRAISTSISSSAKCPRDDGVGTSRSSFNSLNPSTNDPQARSSLFATPGPIPSTRAQSA